MILGGGQSWSLASGQLGLASIVVTAYNQDWVIGETLASIAAQTYRPLECVIVDDGSTDSTSAVIRDFAKRNSASLSVRILHQENQGAQAARNAGIRASTGEYIQFLDGDDVLAPGKLLPQVQFFLSEAGSKSDVVYGDAKWLHDDGTKVWEGGVLGIGPSNDVISTLLNFDRFNPPFSYLCRRAAVERCGPWDGRLKINDDVDYFLRMACTSLQVGQLFNYMPVMTGLYRKHTRPRTSEGGMHLVVRFNTIILKALEDQTRRAGLLTEDREHALAAAYYRVAGWASFIDRPIWEEDLGHCLRLQPNFVPEKPAAALLQRLLGFYAAERLKRKLRIARYGVAARIRSRASTRTAPAHQALS